MDKSNPRPAKFSFYKHSCFNKCLNRIGKAKDPVCLQYMIRSTPCSSVKRKGMKGNRYFSLVEKTGGELNLRSLVLRMLICENY